MHLLLALLLTAAPKHQHRRAHLPPGSDPKTDLFVCGEIKHHRFQCGKLDDFLAEYQKHQEEGEQYNREHSL